MSFDGVSGTLTVAAVQSTPVFLDRAATVEVAARHIASQDAERDAAGAIAGRHRKLVPTGAERLVWAAPPSLASTRGRGDSLRRFGHRPPYG